MNHRLPGLARKGFALVSSLIVMSLLVLLAMGMLGLASISLRTTDVSSAQATAQANARMALLIAIAQLQEHAGPDQRVTAAADLLGETTNSHWVGVWNTTFNDNPAMPLVAGHEAAGYFTDLRSTSPELRNSAWRERQLRGWLVSGSEPSPSGTSAADMVELVGTGTIGNSAPDGERVTAPYVEILDGARHIGGYAWWIGDESLKARVDVASPHGDMAPNPQNPSGGGMHRLAGAAGAGLRDVTAPDGSRPYAAIASMDASRRSNLISLSTVGVAVDDQNAATSFHHVTTHSKGLLVDVVAGSLQKDFTSFLERSGGAPPVASVPGSGLSNNSPIFPAPNFRRSGSSFMQFRNWWNLRDQVGGSFSDPVLDNILPIATRAGITSGSHFNLSSPLPDISRASQPIQPVLTDVRIAFDFTHERRGVRIHLYPRVTLWNPYNVTLRGQTYYVGSNLPQVNNLVIGNQSLVNVEGTNGEMYPGVAPRGTNGHQIYFMLEPIDIGPGETLVFSPDVLNSGGERLARNSAEYVTTNVNANVLSARVPNGTNNFNLLTNRRVPDDVNLASRPEYAFSGGVNQAFDNAPTMVLKRLRREGATVTPATLNSASAETLQLIHFGVNGSKSSWWWYLFGRAMDPVNGGTGFETYTANPNRIPPRLWSLQTRLRWLDETDEQAALGITHGGAGGAFFYNNPVIGNFNARAQMVFRDPFSYYKEWTRYAPGGFMTTWSAPRLNDPRMSIPFRNGKANGSPFSAPNELRGPFAMFEVPRPGMPLFSLASFQHVQLGYHSWQPTYVIGHSNAEPRSDRNATVNREFLNAGAQAWGTNLSRSNERPGTWNALVQNFQNETLIHDVTFAANQMLWDRYFLSTIPHSNNSVAWQPMYEQLPNSNLRVAFTSRPLDLLTGEHTFDHAAAFLANYGAFNVNSTSVEAWRAMLSSLNDVPRPTLAGGAIPDTFSRLLLPITDQQPSTRNAAGTWSGARTLSPAEIESLARTMVDVVRERGPFLGLADFVNRRLDNPTTNDFFDPTICGPLQAAIERSGINTGLQNPSRGDRTSNDSGQANENRNHGAIPPDWDAFYPYKNYGAPGYLTQADVLQTLGPRLTARGDTFVIRTYGEARDATGKVVARAWCEAVVQRTPDYVFNGGEDGVGNQPLESTAIRSARGFGQEANPDLEDLNRKHGRRFVIESFRWLAPSEI